MATATVKAVTRRNATAYASARVEKPKLHKETEYKVPSRKAAASADPDPPVKGSSKWYCKAF
jgi:hypothetical protein